MLRRLLLPPEVELRGGVATQDGAVDKGQNDDGAWQRTLIGCRVSDGKVTVQKLVELVMFTCSTVALLAFGPWALDHSTYASSIASCQPAFERTSTCFIHRAVACSSGASCRSQGQHHPSTAVLLDASHHDTGAEAHADGATMGIADTPMRFGMSTWQSGGLRRGDR